MDKNTCVTPDDLAVFKATFHTDRANIIATHARGHRRQRDELGS